MRKTQAEELEQEPRIAELAEMGQEQEPKIAQLAWMKLGQEPKFGGLASLELGMGPMFAIDLRPQAQMTIVAK